MGTVLEDFFGEQKVQRRTKDRLQRQPNIVTTHGMQTTEDPAFNAIGRALMLTPIMDVIANTPPSKNVETGQGYRNTDKDQSRVPSGDTMTEFLRMLGVL